MLFPPYEGDPAQLPALTLAYIGDGVYELFVRRRMLENEGIKAHNLHRQAIKRVNAQAQANLLKKLKDELNEEEEAIARRGRNAKSGQIPKNANVGEYRLATGLEMSLNSSSVSGKCLPISPKPAAPKRASIIT